MKQYIGNGLTITMEMRLKHNRNRRHWWCVEVGVKSRDDLAAFFVLYGLPSKCSQLYVDDEGRWCASVKLSEYRNCCEWARCVTKPKHKVRTIFTRIEEAENELV